MSALTTIAHTQAKEELFAHRLYAALADRMPEGNNRAVLKRFAEEEASHVDFWAGVGDFERSTLRPSRIKHRLLLIAARLVGLAFTIRWLEKGEDRAIATYRHLLTERMLTPEQATSVEQMLQEEEEHEQLLEREITDERRIYLGAAVLGLNDALVELTGGLTGMVSSISDPRVIAFAGLVVGVSAAGSMAASNFLSIDIGEDSELEPRKAAVYTGTAYIFVVLALVAPFFTLSSRQAAMAMTWAVAIVIIAAFSFYSSVMQGVGFWRRFGLMFGLGFGVAVIAFGIGRALGSILGIDL